MVTRTNDSISHPVRRRYPRDFRVWYLVPLPVWSTLWSFRYVSAISSFLSCLTRSPVLASVLSGFPSLDVCLTCCPLFALFDPFPHGTLGALAAYIYVYLCSSAYCFFVSLSSIHTQSSILRAPQSILRSPGYITGDCTFRIVLS